LSRSSGHPRVRGLITPRYSHILRYHTLDKRLNRIMAHSSSLAPFQDFAEAHALPSKIQFNTRVLKVPISSSEVNTERYNKLIVCV
jgi:hypothetical protein